MVLGLKNDEILKFLLPEFIHYLSFFILCHEIPVDGFDGAGKRAIDHFGLFLFLLDHLVDQIFGTVLLILRELLRYAFDVPLNEIYLFLREKVFSFFLFVLSEIVVKVIRMSLIEKTMFLALFILVEYSFFSFVCLFFR